MSYVRRLLRRLEFPHEAPRLLQHDRYWRVEVVEALCDRCDETAELGDSAGEELLAEVTYDLISRLREPPRALWIRVFFTLGTARRRRGRYGQARKCYEAAWRLCDRGSVSLETVAALAERHAVLLRELGQLERALEMIRYALLLRESVGSQTTYARLIEGTILVYRGEVDSAKQRFAAVLRETDPREEERAYYAALENLAYVLGAYGSPEDLLEAKKLMGEMRRAIRGIRRTPVRYKLDWADAVLHLRLGDLRRARRGLIRARQGFVRQGMPTELIAVTLDLVVFELASGLPGEVEPLLVETLDQIRAIDLDSPLATACLFALERETPEEMVETLRERLGPTTDFRRGRSIPLEDTLVVDEAVEESRFSTTSSS